MDETAELVNALGLLLTQTRFSRRALEDIERSTASYAGFAFTSVIAAGPRFGEPPLFDGALRVHVINISDLAPGGGFGGFLEGLLGGIGRFLGNLPGGLIGGTISSIALVRAIPTIHEIARHVDRILTMLGLGAPQEPGRAGAAPEGRGSTVGGSTLVAQLDSIKRAVDALTGLFLAAGGQPDQAATVSALPSTPEGERWVRLLDSTSVVLDGIARVVNGLIIALPLVLGTIASLISRLGDIRLAIAETLQFALRNALMLRGAVAVLAFDTLAMVARMAAAVVGILASTLDGIISAVFDTVREALLAVLQLAAVLGGAVKTTVDDLLNWLVPTVDTVLRNLSDLPIFRVIVHLVRILPAIVPPIYEIARDAPVPGTTALGTALPGTPAAALRDAAALAIPGPLRPAAPGATSPTVPPPAPDLAAVFTDPAMIARATGALDRIEQVTADGLRIVATTAEGGLRTLGTRLDAAALAETRLSDATLGTHLAAVREQSTSLARSLVVGEPATAQTGLEAIATAYESWLTGGGLSTLLGRITTHFSSEQGRTGAPQRIVEGSMDRPRATVQIDEVVIEVQGGPPADLAPSRGEDGQPLGPGDFPLPPQGEGIERYARMWFDYDQRGGGSRLPLYS